MKKCKSLCRVGDKISNYMNQANFKESGGKEQTTHISSHHWYNNFIYVSPFAPFYFRYKIITMIFKWF